MIFMEKSRRIVVECMSEMLRKFILELHGVHYLGTEQTYFGQMCLIVNGSTTICFPFFLEPGV